MRERKTRPDEEIFNVVYDTMRGETSLKDVVARKEELLSLVEKQNNVKRSRNV